MSSETQAPSDPSSPAEVHGWLRALFDESPIAIAFSRDGVTLEANRAYVVLFGYASTAELRGASILDQIAPTHRERVRENVTMRARGLRAPHRYTTRGLRKDGTEFPFEITTARIVLPDGPLTIAFITDVSERDDALEALRASEERFRTLSGAAVEGVFLHADGKIVLANEAGAAMYGYDPISIIGTSVMDLTAPESRQAVVDHVRRAASDEYEGFGRRKDGSVFAVEVRGRTLSHQGRPMRVAIIRDVSERKRVETEQRALAERVRHAQKLESLGILAGGVAHDFNNILTVIANGVALAKREPGLPPAATDHLESIALATERAADLCRQMLAYAGKTPFARTAVDLSSLVAEMSTMLEVSVGRRATLARSIAHALPPLLGDATQIRQIVMNLVMNAAEAIDRPLGTVSVSTGVGTFTAEDLARSPAGGDPPGGMYVYVEVKDDGVGMGPATIAQMFDPFFTTKFTGRGLGMAAVLGIVRAHAGALDVDSTPGEGTRIRVFFPVSAVKPASRSSRPDALPSPRGVVLLVEDEKNVRTSTQLLLEDFGFEVVPARDGIEALEAFREHSTRIAVVLLDLTMPRMDGVETLRELRRIAPQLPVVITTGHGTTYLEDAAVGDTPEAVLAKPYSAAQLIDALEEALRGRK